MRISSWHLPMCLTAISLVFVSCTQKLEQDTAELRKQVHELKSKNQAYELDAAELKTKQAEMEKRIDELKLKFIQMDDSNRKLVSKIDGTKIQNLNEQVTKVTDRLEKTLQIVLKDESDLSSLKEWGEEQQKIALEKKTALEHKIDYAKSSLNILNQCKKAIEEPPFVASSSITEAKKNYRDLCDRFPEQQNSSIHDHLDAILDMTEKRISENDSSTPNTPLSMIEKLDMETRAEINAVLK